MSYNICCLRGDGRKPFISGPMTDEQMNEAITNFDGLLTREAPDILIITEDRTFFDTDCFATTGGEKSVYELLFKKFFHYAYHTAGGANFPHIYSKYPIKSVERLNVEYPTEDAEQRKPTLVTVKVNGIDVIVIGCHPVSGLTPERMACRQAYYNSIVDYISDKPYVIIAGDMNNAADGKGEMKPFADAGLTLGNHGAFGSFVTYRDTRGFMIDNIITKGLLMKNFVVGQEDYSDHCPVYSEVYLP